MNTLVKYSNSNKATVCADKNCVTVYGRTKKTQPVPILIGK